MKNLWFRGMHIYNLQIPARHSTTHVFLCQGSCMFPGPLPPAIVPHHLHFSQTPSKTLFLVISADNFIHKYMRKKNTFKVIRTWSTCFWVSINARIPPTIQSLGRTGHGHCPRWPVAPLTSPLVSVPHKLCLSSHSSPLPRLTEHRLLGISHQRHGHRLPTQRSDWGIALPDIWLNFNSFKNLLIVQKMFLHWKTEAAKLTWQSCLWSIPLSANIWVSCSSVPDPALILTDVSRSVHTQLMKLYTATRNTESSIKIKLGCVCYWSFRIYVCYLFDCYSYEKDCRMVCYNRLFENYLIFLKVTWK